MPLRKLFTPSLSGITAAEKAAYEVTALPFVTLHHTSIILPPWRRPKDAACCLDSAFPIQRVNDKSK